jgi:3-oxosteroid 1-dehydrogenase
VAITLSADAIVVGSGAAGLSAALTTARQGLKTVVLERTGVLGGTSAMSGGLVYAPGSKLAREAGHEFDVNDVVRYLKAIARREVDQNLIDTFLDAAPAMVDQLADSGVALRLTGLLDYYRDAPGAGAARVVATHPFDPSALGEHATLVRRSPYRDSDEVPWRSGMSLVGHLLAACLHAGVQFRTNCRVRSLLIEDGAVVGVEGACHGEPLTASGGGVVLASGGYEFNRALVGQYIGTNLEGAWSCPGNEGDALAMAKSVNASLTSMGEAQWYALLRLSEDRLEGAPLFADASPARNLPGSLIVDRRGARFANESTLFQDFGRALAYPDANRTPAWLVCDQRFLHTYRRQAFGDQPLVSPAWHTAHTLAELATQIDVPAHALATTVAQFNEGAVDGVDLEFGRGESDVDREWGDADAEGGHSCLAPLVQPPFHATRVYAGCSGTTGGPRVDANAQVRRADGQPVKGLYAAGNVIAGLFGDTAPASGSTLGPGMTFGFLAGKSIGRTFEQR